MAARLLEDQRRLVGWQIASERAGFALKVLTGLAGVAAAAVLAAMVWQARQADGLAIKPFSVPPELAARGVTGEAVASQMLDHLSRMSEVAVSSEVQRRVSAERGENISIEIPQTGVSLSQVDQWLREKLGRQVRVTGELIAEPDGSLRLVARAGASPLASQTGPAGDLNGLVARMAEALYASQQPRTYWLYLRREGREAEAFEVAKRMAQNPDPQAQAIGWLIYGNSVQVLQGRAPAMAAFRRSRELDRYAHPAATGNLSRYEIDAGHMELGYRLTLERRQVLAGNRTSSAGAQRSGELQSQYDEAELLGDPRRGLAAARALASMTVEGSNSPPQTFRDNLALALARAHDLTGARETLAAREEAFGEPPRASVVISTAMAAEDWAAAARACEAVPAGLASQPDGGALSRRPRADCALAMVRAGRVAEAEALLAPTPLDCQPCVISRAVIAEAKGDRRAADHWFAEASHMAPSLPRADYEWARALLARGDPAGALRRLAEARRRSPNFADAIEATGEAQLAQGDAKAAAAEFARAAGLTPKWGRLHLKWGQALAKLGKMAEARAEFARAATLGLTAAERAELKP